jgi:hypothetical protein
MSINFTPIELHLMQSKLKEGDLQHKYVHLTAFSLKNAEKQGKKP